jgi:hypothetical protein
VQGHFVLSLTSGIRSKKRTHLKKKKKKKKRQIIGPYTFVFYCFGEMAKALFHWRADASSSLFVFFLFVCLFVCLFFPRANNTISVGSEFPFRFCGVVIYALFRRKRRLIGT